MITALQHVGIGVHDTERTFAFYRDLMGFRVKFSDETEYQTEMTPIIGSLVEMRISMAMNVAGGGAIELFEHTSTLPMEPGVALQWGDIGYLELGLNAHRLDELYSRLEHSGIEFITPILSMILSSSGIERYAYLRDPDGLLIQLVEVPVCRRTACVGGVRHVAIGVSDMQKARAFYRDVLGFSDVVHEFRGTMPELQLVTDGKKSEMVVLRQRPAAKSALPLLERAIVKLVHTPGYHGRPAFEGRRWGDIGMVEMAFDVTNLNESANDLASRGAEILYLPARVDMGQGTTASFAYLLSPDGIILELAEVERIMRVSPRVMKYVLVWLIKAAAQLGIV